MPAWGITHDQSPESFVQSTISDVSYEYRNMQHSKRIPVFTPFK